MSILFNLDTLFNGVNILAIAILGLLVFINDRHSRVNKIFGLFALTAIIYSIINYLSYHITNPLWILWLLRLVLCSSVWYAFVLFYFVYTFSNPKKPLPYLYRNLLILAVIAVSLIALSPLAFPSLDFVAPVGIVSKAIHGPGMAAFGIAVSFFVFASIYILLKNMWTTNSAEMRQHLLIFIGTTVTYTLIIIFNFVLPVIFDNLAYIPLAPLFTIPFISLTAYAIVKLHLFNIKVIATELLTFVLWFALLLRLTTSQGTGDTIISSLVLIAAVAFGILLIKSVLHEVALREQMTKLALDLELANKDLERLDQAKSDFISIASHQLRTPLSIIKGYISMIQEGSFGKLTKQLADPLHKVYVSNERLINLVSDLLDLSRMERGKMQYDFKPVHFSEIVESFIGDFDVVAKSKKMKLEWKKEFTSDLVSADAGKVRQIVLNLIDNAFKYTTTGGVTVALTQKDHTICFSVTDTGPGLTLEESHALFQKFARGKEEGRAHTEGLGLGLYVAKLIAEAHGGSLGVSSPGKGKGSTFALTIPLLVESHQTPSTEFIENI